MNSLDTNWLTQGLLDSEYKQYVLLAFLQHCRKQFDANKLYPPLSQLIEHYRNAKELMQKMETLQNNFPRELAQLDLQRMKLEYESLFTNDENMKVVAEIIGFAIPRLKQAMDEGMEIYELLEQHISLQPIGLVPVYCSEGYLLLNDDPQIHVYQYQHSVISSADDTLRSLSVQYVYTDSRSIANPVETIKLNLIRKFSNLPNPATWLCQCKLRLPMAETFLPIAKRSLMRQLALIR